MTIEQAKLELVRRYIWLYENKEFILAPFINERESIVEEDPILCPGIVYTEKGIAINVDGNLELIQEYKEPQTVVHYYIELSKFNVYNTMLEEFLFSELPFEQSEFYKFIESKKQDQDYCNLVEEKLRKNEEVKKAFEEEEIDQPLSAAIPAKLSMWDVLQDVLWYIEKQTANPKNRNAKLAIMKLYYQILEYKNDGIVCKEKSFDIPWEESELRNKYEPYVPTNKFISAIRKFCASSTEGTIFTPEELREMFLRYPDVSFNKVVTCKHCNGQFPVSSVEIYVNPEHNDDSNEMFQQICPHCLTPHYYSAKDLPKHKKLEMYGLTPNDMGVQIDQTPADNMQTLINARNCKLLPATITPGPAITFTLNAIKFELPKPKRNKKKSRKRIEKNQ